MRWPINPISNAVRQVAGIAGPIDRVRVSAAVDPATPLALRVQWPMGDWVPDPDNSQPGIALSSASRPADHSIRVDAEWQTIAEVDQWMYETAWALGAGYLYRWMRAPSPDPEFVGAQIAARHDWGEAVYTIMGDDDTLGDAQPEMAQRALRDGYWTWECNVGYRGHEWRLHAGKWQAEWEAAGDVHEPDGSRHTAVADRLTWQPRWVAELAQTFERLAEPERLVLQIAADLVHQRYQERP